MKKPLNICLFLPYYKLWNSSKEKNAYFKKISSRLNEFIEKFDVGLIVFPEEFGHANNINDAVDVINEWDYKIPVLSGFSVDSNKGEWAVYYNPAPKKHESKVKYYCKHSTAGELAFDLPDYRKIQNDLFSPILLNGHQIQANICHDIFFPLITEKMEKSGMDVLINLTGGNVQLSKWHNVFQGRSLETDIPVFCTMNYFSLKESGNSEAFGFYNGQKLLPNEKVGSIENEEAEFVMFSLSGLKSDQDFVPVSNLSKNVYKDFRIGLDTEAACNVSLIVKKDVPFCIDIKSKKETNLYKDWYLQMSKKIGMIGLNYNDLKLRSKLFEFEYPKGIENYFVIYYSKDKVDVEKTISLMKLRAIEARIGAICLAPNLKVLIKTNNYKNIQMFKPVNDVIGTNLQNLGGINSIYTKGRNNVGMPERVKDQYLSLK
jgi:hypothetical protein